MEGLVEKLKKLVDKKIPKKGSEIKKPKSAGQQKKSDHISNHSKKESIKEPKQDIENLN